MGGSAELNYPMKKLTPQIGARWSPLGSVAFLPITSNYLIKTIARSFNGKVMKDGRDKGVIGHKEAVPARMTPLRCPDKVSREVRCGLGQTNG